MELIKTIKIQLTEEEAGILKARISEIRSCTTASSSDKMKGQVLKEMLRDNQNALVGFQWVANNNCWLTMLLEAVDCDLSTEILTAFHNA